MLERCLGVKGIKANTSKRNLSHSIVNTIGGKDLRALKRLIKAENTIVILLRLGIIGLKDWLYWVGVLVGNLRCKYSWPRQTLKHIILSCPLYTNQEAMLLAAGIENYNILLLI